MKDQFYLSLILILTCVFVRCDKVEKDPFTVSICSFVPETPEPTRTPIPPVPTTPKPKPTTDSDTGTFDDDATESEKPSTDSTTTAVSDTSAATSATTQEATTADTTTPAGTTTKTEVATTTPLDDSTTDEENEGGNQENQGNNKGIKEDGELLVYNKNRFLLEYGEFPPQQNDELIKSFALSAFNTTCKDKGLEFNIEGIEISVEYKYTKGEDRVTYEITFSEIFINNTVENNKTWEGIINELEGNNGTFYSIMNNLTNDNYTTCEMPNRLKEPTPCSYDKTYYEYLAINEANDKIVSPNATNVNVSYAISCTKDYVTPDNTNGQLKVDIKTKQSFAYCNIQCSAEGYRNNYNQLTFVVKDNLPSFTKVGSVVPFYQNSEEVFSITMKVVYAEGVDATSKKMTISNSGSCTLEGKNEVEGSTKFVFNDLKYKCPYTNTFSERITFTIESVTKQYAVQVVERPKFVPNENPSTNADGSTQAPVEPEYTCKEELSLDPTTNLCCKRDEVLGESCNSVIISFPFAKTGSESITKLDEGFVEDYIKMLRQYAFDESNFNFTIINDGSDMKIEINVKFYSQKTFIYSGGELIRRRSLQQGMNWNALPSPFLYIQTVVSYIEPTAVTDTSGEGNVANEIPPILLEAFPEATKDTIISKIETVKKEASVAATQISAEYNVVLDTEQGISLMPSVDNTAVAPEVTNGRLETVSKPDDKSWAEKNWWVILIICLVVVILIAVIGVVLYIKLSNKSGGGSSLSPRSVSTSKKDLEKSEKIMDTVIPLEKFKEDNGVEDEDIYKPFTYDVIMEGYLLKEGHDRVVGKWQKRYCVLYYDPAILRIYDSMVPSYYGKVYLEEKQSIPLDCYNGIEYKDGSSEFTLVLKVRESNLKTYEPGDKEKKVIMKVEGENAKETAKKWVECFRDFKNQKPKPAEAWTRPLVVDESSGKITTTTERGAEKKNEEIINMVNQRRKQTREN